MNNAVSLSYLAEARHNLLNHNYGRAYAFYLLVLKISPYYQQSIREDFGAAWREWSMQLCDFHKIEDLFSLYEQGCELFMESDTLHYCMGCCLYKLNMKLEAVDMFRKALLVNKHCFEAIVSLENASRGLVDSWHFSMLNDKIRNKCFDIAIEHTLGELNFDDTVLDIGSGSGILSMLAVRHGADKVHACESSKVMHNIAKECIQENQIKGKIQLFNCDSLAMTVKNVMTEGHLPNKASLVISETVDAGLLGEGVIDTLNHGWKHLLISPENGGIVIPYSASVYCSVVESDQISSKHSCFNVHGFKNLILKSGVGELAAQTNSTFFKTCNLEPYTSEKMSKFVHKNLSESYKILDINFNDPNVVEKIAQGRHESINTDISILLNGYADAVILWFKLELESPENQSNCINTEIASNFCWDQAVYPIRVFSDENNNCTISRLQVNDNLILRLNFDVNSDCFFLNKVDVMKKDGTTLNSCLQSFSEHYDRNKTISHDFFSLSIPEEQIERNNDQVFCNKYFHTICLHTKKNVKTILDISSGFDLLALKFKQILGDKVDIRKFCQTENIYEAVSQLANQYNISIQIYKKLPELKFDIIMSDIVEPSGLLSPNSIKNVVETKLLLSEAGVFIPSKIDVIAQCISSDELVQKCLVTTDQNTLGLKIAEHINDYRVSVYSDLDISSLDYISLSQPVKVFCIDFNSGDQVDLLNIQKSIVTKITNSGKMHGILFWFKIYLSDDEVLVTKDPDNHWKQAAYVFPMNKQLDFNQGAEVVLKMICQNDSIIFTVSKYGS